MKKLIAISILTLTIILFLTKTIDTQEAFIEKINLNLENNEIALTFLNYELGEYILISTIEEKILLVLNSNNQKELNDTLNIFNSVEIDYLLLTTEEEVELGYENKIVLGHFNKNNLKIKKEEEKITIIYGENIFNIYLKELENINGNFVYLLFESNNHIKLEEDIHIIFYTEEIKLNDNFMEEIYSKWIDLYKVKEGEWTTLKLKPDNYKMITIPSDK